MVDKAIREFVDQAVARAQFLRDGVEAWEDYKRTSKYISEERADAWLARLEAGEDIDPPAEE